MCTEHGQKATLKWLFLSKLRCQTRPHARYRKVVRTRKWHAVKRMGKKFSHDIDHQRCSMTSSYTMQGPQIRCMQCPRVDMTSGGAEVSYGKQGKERLCLLPSLLHLASPWQQGMAEFPLGTSINYVHKIFWDFGPPPPPCQHVRS